MYYSPVYAYTSSVMRMDANERFMLICSVFFPPWKIIMKKFQNEKKTKKILKKRRKIQIS